MCTCTYKNHGLQHCKYVLHCCDKCPIIFLTIQEANKNTTNTCPTIIFHVYRNVSRCTVNGRRQYNKLPTCSMYSTVPIYESTSKAYKQKELVLLETRKKEFNGKLCIPEIQKLAFHLQHVRILGNRHCSKELRDTFKCRGNSHDVL